MEITVQITVKSQAGDLEVIQEVARLERGTLWPDNLGLSLAGRLAERTSPLVHRCIGARGRR